MLTTLFESQHQRTSSFRAQVVSVTLHAGLILGAIVATQTVIEAGGAPESRTSIVYLPPTPEVISDCFCKPIDLPQLPALPAMTSVVRVPNVLPEIDLLRNLFLSNRDEIIVSRGQPGGDSNGAAAPTGVGGMTAEQVDRPAHLLPGSGRPAFPEMLRTVGVSGEVLVQFVVDSLGRADMATLVVLKSSHAWFTGSVKRALETARFAPAEFNGRRVRQIVRMPFVFSLQR